MLKPGREAISPRLVRIRALKLNLYTVTCVTAPPAQAHDIVASVTNKDALVLLRMEAIVTGW